jgi:uncharacterized protein (TIGR02265 family)
MELETIQPAIDASTPLIGEVDVEALIATIPEHYSIRGLFFKQLVADLGDEFAALTPKLCAPPPSGSYLALTSYPIRDHLRVIDAAACHLYPDYPNREAHRRRARTELGNFARSKLGKAILSVIRDPATLLVRYPEIFDAFTKGPKGRGSREGTDAVKIELTDYFGSVDYQVGLVEGFVMNFGFTPRTEVFRQPPNKLIFLVAWR